MKKITISNNLHSIEMTQLVIGDNSLTAEGKREFAFSCIDRYLENGGNTIDTARLYGKGQSEYVLGEYLKTRQRENIILVTKCGHYDRNLVNPPHRLGKDEIVSDVDTSLEALGVDYVDVLFVHRDDIKRPVEEIMPVLDSFVKSGRVRILGASNWTGGRIAAANKFANENGLTPFSVSQICWNLGLTTAAQTNDLSHVIMDNAEYTWYREQNFPCMAWSSTAHGFFSKYAEGAEIKPSVLYRYGWLEENYKRAERVKLLAAGLGKPVGAVVLSYIMSADIPSCAISTFSSYQQLDEALLSTRITLTADQRAYLEMGDLRS